MADLKTRIVEHLTKKGTYDPDVDDDMIDDLCDSVTLGKTLLKRLQKEGAIMEYWTTSGSRMLKLSPVLTAYQMIQRNTYQLSTKLGINRNDRLKLKIVEQKEKDELDKLLSQS